MLLSATSNRKFNGTLTNIAKCLDVSRINSQFFALVIQLAKLRICNPLFSAQVWASA